MSAGDALTRIVAALDRAGVPHMLAGSHASGFHGGWSGEGGGAQPGRQSWYTSDFGDVTPASAPQMRATGGNCGGGVAGASTVRP